ncbi:peptidoglycan-binding protein [Sulfitobacter sp. TSTF-M16]|uniref:Peptidoglycan-binding protein n=2 Tax=Sulfitobacter aestuariivivens TaxID=2766981 RepID=A0A927D135_9RHOB|nr:peptidoglycan-binding protein [Sulfitobacter aestuariivivens]
MNSKRYAASLIITLAVVLTGCDPVSDPVAPTRKEPGVMAATRDGPPGAAEGTCWGRTVSPAVVQTVVKQVQVKPAQVNPDGTVAAPPKYRTEERQEIVTPRVDNWFETPCGNVLTPEFYASLQRALAARGYYGGTATGVFDPPTRAAMRNYQRENGGPDSPVLALATARLLGLVAVPRS